MPLSINVGLSRKASRNYQSDGVSINITAELDQSLLARPEELQVRIDELYAQAEQAVIRRVSQSPQHTPVGNCSSTCRGVHGVGGGSIASPRHGVPSNGGAAMTRSQRRAIESIAQRLGFDPAQVIERASNKLFDALTVREASLVIDRLKDRLAGVAAGRRS